MGEGERSRREGQEEGKGFAGPVSNCFLRACRAVVTTHARAGNQGQSGDKAEWKRTDVERTRPTAVVCPLTLSSYGDRTFAAAGPCLCNSLPVQLRNPDITYGLFRR